MNADKIALRGATLSFRADPFFTPLAEAMVYHQDGLVVIEQGRIVASGAAAELLPGLDPAVEVRHEADSLILPGFVDTHVHFAQIEMVAAFGEQLIDWLRRYTFPTEARFADRSHADAVAQVFLREQLRNGITTACVFCTVHPQSVDALFAAAAGYDLRILAGKVCMDRHAPPDLLDSAERAYRESLALIERWHGRGRAEYVITPRFAPTSSPAQLEALGALAQAYPGMAIQSHLSENRAELAWIRELFPDSANYTDVYRRHGLLRPRAIYGHGVHLDDEEFALLADSGSALAHCPTSNFFLGSGCFDLQRARRAARPVRVGLGSDLGAGTSFSMLRIMAAAYQAAQLNGYALSAPQAFYLATRGGAEALGLADRIGALEPGKEADLVVLDLRPTPFVDFRMRQADSLEEVLFVLMTLADDRAVRATYVAGRQVSPD
jgi:guanine deaminase